MRKIASSPKKTCISQGLRKEFASLARRWIEVDTPNPAVAGIALERTGRYKVATEFYDEYVDAEDPEIRSFARERYIATTKKWTDFYLDEEKLSAAISLENEIDRRIESWGIDDSTYSEVAYNAIDMDHDSIQKIIGDRLDPKADSEVETATGESTDSKNKDEDRTLPEDSEKRVPEPDDEGPVSESDEEETPNLDITLRLEHNEQNRRIRIYFESTDNGASIDFNRRDVASQGWVELDKHSDEDKVVFSLSPEDSDGTRVEGVITKDENPCTRLDIEGLDHVLEISL
jgi:hypothetical protein